MILANNEKVMEILTKLTKPRSSKIIMADNNNSRMSSIHGGWVSILISSHNHKYKGKDKINKLMSLLSITLRMYLTLMRINRIGGIRTLIILEEINRLELIQISLIKTTMIILITLELIQMIILQLSSTILGDNLLMLLNSLMNFKRNKLLKVLLLLIKLINHSAANSSDLLHRIKKNQLPPKVKEVTRNNKRMHSLIHPYSKHTSSQMRIQARDRFHLRTSRINLKINFKIKNNQVGNHQLRMRTYSIQQRSLTHLISRMPLMDLEQLKCSLKLLDNLSRILVRLHSVMILILVIILLLKLIRIMQEIQVIIQHNSRIQRNGDNNNQIHGKDKDHRKINKNSSKDNHKQSISSIHIHKNNNSSNKTHRIIKIINGSNNNSNSNMPLHSLNSIKNKILRIHHSLSSNMINHNLIRCNNSNHLNQLFRKSNENQQFLRREEIMQMEKLI